MASRSHEVAHKHEFAGRHGAHLIETDDRLMQGGDEFPGADAHLPAPPIPILVGQVASVWQGRADEILEGGTPYRGDTIFADNVAKVRKLDVNRPAGPDGVPVDEISQERAPLLTGFPGPQTFQGSSEVCEVAGVLRPARSPRVIKRPKGQLGTHAIATSASRFATPPTTALLLVTVKRIPEGAGWSRRGRDWKNVDFEIVDRYL